MSSLQPSTGAPNAWMLLSLRPAAAELVLWLALVWERVLNTYFLAFVLRRSENNSRTDFFFLNSGLKYCFTLTAFPTPLK